MKFMQKRKAFLGLIILVLLIIGGVVAYLNEEKEENTLSYEALRVEERNISARVSATGTIRPVDSVEVSSKITARIKEVLVKENDRVTAGQPVAILDGEDYEASMNQAGFKVENTRSKYKRAEYLYSIGAKSQEAYEDAKFEKDSAETALMRAESDLNETIILAPMDGIVVGEPKTAGTMAVQGNSNPTVIMTIADLSKKQILAKVDETDIGRLKVGQRAEFTVDAYGEKKFSAQVAKISKTDVGGSWNVNSTNSSSSNAVIYYYVVLDVEDKEDLLLPAMTARVEIIVEEKEAARVIPISALKTDAKGSYVMYKESNGELKEKYVQTGIYSDEYVEIVSGLQVGEEIVIVNKNTRESKAQANAFGPPPR